MDTTDVVTWRDPVPHLWLWIACLVCLPAALIALRRVWRWWVLGRSLPLPLDRAMPAVRWSVQFGFLLFLGTFLLAMFLGDVYVRMAAKGLLPWEPLDVPYSLSPGVFLAQIVPPLIGLAVVLRFGRGAAATVGVRAGRVWPEIVRGLGIVVIVLPLCVAGTAAGVFLMWLFRLESVEHPSFAALREWPQWWVLLLTVLQASVLAPLGEEFLYRGILQTTLLKAVGPFRALIATSALFAVVHVLYEPQAVPGLFILGLGLGYAAYRTRSLLAPIIAHSAFNTLMVLGTFFGGS
ncbi:MAG TPA: type II CAAX endopeptidase family protein [Phycisphaerae bacterium]|nr:type II CAAX endopeptidase family protein [Phycisphaerae bacterium]